MLPLENGFEIDAMLATPTNEIGVIAFANMVHVRTIRLRVVGGTQHLPPQLLTDALRGALGRALMDQASPEALRGDPCPWRPASALDVLWRERSQTRGLVLPKPITFDVQSGVATTTFNIRLFGLATAWSGVVAEALARALRVGIRTQGGLDFPREAISLEQDESERPADALPHFVRVSFRTPLRWRSETTAAFDIGIFFSMLANRVSGLARWHGLTLCEDWKALRCAADALPWDLNELVPVVGRRKSGRQQRTFEAEGWEGAFSGAGDFGALAGLLQVGAYCGVGSNAALGLGRYDLAWA